MCELIHTLRYDYEGLAPGTSLGANLAAGAFAGIMEHTVMYPVDAIKVVKRWIP